LPARAEYHWNPFEHMSTGGFLLFLLLLACFYLGFPLLVGSLTCWGLRRRWPTVTASLRVPLLGCTLVWWVWLKLAYSWSPNSSPPMDPAPVVTAPLSLVELRDSLRRVTADPTRRAQLAVVADDTILALVRAREQVQVAEHQQQAARVSAAQGKVELWVCCIGGTALLVGAAAGSYWLSCQPKAASKQDH
jgi:hypothetical protein